VLPRVRVDGRSTAAISPDRRRDGLSDDAAVGDGSAGPPPPAAETWPT
jgi:hypothetical protein